MENVMQGLVQLVMGFVFLFVVIVLALLYKHWKATPAERVEVLRERHQKKQRGGVNGSA